MHIPVNIHVYVFGPQKFVFNTSLYIENLFKCTKKKM